MEFIPDAGTSLKINDYAIEVMQVKNNMVKTVRLSTDQITQVRQVQAELPLDG
jgi:Mg2+/Co2+ transporter CorB